jgi:hypothetical protein
MKIAKTKVWAHIKDDEKMALTLTLANCKSTWEAGAIMEKSHYKFLEIAQRGKMFIRLFTQHYDLYPNFWSPDLSINPIVKDYFDLVVRKRMKPTDALKKLQHPVFSLSSVRNRMLMDELNKWENSKVLSEVMFFQFIKEFDRWNNFRVLPKEAQEPHGFKRRNKNTLKLYLKNWISLKQKKPSAFEELEALDRPLCKKDVAYFMLMDDYRSFVYRLITVRLKNNDGTKAPGIRARAILLKHHVFMFKTEQEAFNFAELVSHYFCHGHRKSEEGLIFWPKSRVFITKALNHDEIMGIAPTREISPRNPFQPKEKTDLERIRKFNIRY